MEELVRGVMGKVTLSGVSLQITLESVHGDPHMWDFKVLNGPKNMINGLNKEPRHGEKGAVSDEVLERLEEVLIASKNSFGQDEITRL